MSTWALVVTGLLGIIASAAVNIFIVGIYIGKYQGDLRSFRHRIGEMEEERKASWEMLSSIRERLRWCESRLNGSAWKKEN